MRQTRRSRSAATPQKDEPANQVEESNVGNVKANLETVFEKEGDLKDEVGVAVEQSEDMQSENQSDAGVSGDAPNEESGPSGNDKAGSSPAKAASPKKTDSGVIELNCKVCNCSFTNYQEHMNSEAHKSKISHSSPKPDTQANADKPNAAQSLKRSGDQDSAPSPKRMRNQNQNAQNASTDKFHCDVCKITMLKQQDFEHHMNGKRHMMNVTRAQGKAYCDVCKLFFNTVTDLNDHTESQLHKKNLAEKKQDKQAYECTVCNITSVGLKQYEQHLISKRHKRSLTGGTSAGNTGTTATAGTVNGKAENKPQAQGPNKKWLYVCNACTFGCNQDQEFSAHMNLADHKAAVTDMRKKGLVLEKGAANKAAPKPAAAKPAAAKPAAAKPAAAKPAPRPLMGTNAAQNVRKFQHNNFAGGPRNAGPAGGPRAGGPGPVFTKVTYNIVSGPNVNANAPGPAKQAPMKKDGPQVNRKVPGAAPIGPGGLKKNVPVNKPNMPINKPPMGGRPNPRFQGQQLVNQPNKFMANPQPLKLGYQKMPFEAAGNFGQSFGPSSSDAGNASGNFGNYGGRGIDNYAGNINPVSDMRGDFRGNARDDFRADVRDIRDIRDVRGVDMPAEPRGEVGFRSGFSYRDMPADTARDVRGDYGGNFRGDVPASLARSDVRSGLGPDTRGDMRGIAGRDVGGDLRSYSNNDIRDLRNDSRSDYTMRDRNTMSGYGGSAGYGQQNYRGTDDYRADSYGRAGQPSGQASSAGNYSSGMMASGRYDSYMDRTSSSYSNQYGGTSRGMGYMGDMPLNGR